MDHQTDITFNVLQQALESTDEKTPALRLEAVIAYKNGLTQPQLA